MVNARSASASPVARWSPSTRTHCCIQELVGCMHFHDLSDVLVRCMRMLKMPHTVVNPTPFPKCSKLRHSQIPGTSGSHQYHPSTIRWFTVQCAQYRLPFAAQSKRACYSFTGCTGQVEAYRGHISQGLPLRRADGRLGCLWDRDASSRL